MIHVTLVSIPQCQIHWELPRVEKVAVSLEEFPSLVPSVIIQLGPRYCPIRTHQMRPYFVLSVFALAAYDVLRLMHIGQRV